MFILKNEIKKFSLEEVKKLSSILYRLTDRTDRELLTKNANNCHESYQKWADQVRKLGGIPVAYKRIRLKSYSDSYYLWEYGKEIMIH